MGIPYTYEHTREGGREGRGTEKALRSLENKMPTLKRNRERSIYDIIETKYPEDLKDVAALLVTLPVTQVSVERLFSAMKLFKSDLRSRMKADALESLLILKANQ